MTQQTVGGGLLKDMLMTGAALLEKNKKHIDSLNVFPVPDGDTGTNMSLTVSSSVRELKSIDSNDAHEVAHAASQGALKGARGNSGVILSQLFRGFAKALEGVSEMDAHDWARALQSGADSAYKAVMKPKEGTILTVASYIAAKAHEDAEKGLNIYKLIDNMLINGALILEKTPDMLPVLKEAGVVDAGGKGLLTIYTGYKMALDGEEVTDIPAQDAQSSGVETNISDFGEAVTLDSLGEIKFAYCTELFIERLDGSFADSEVDMLSQHLERIGDSIVCVGDGSIIKVHVHTNVPGKVLQLGLRLGELNGIKVDNMVDQNRKLVAERKAREKEYGMVAISSGDGFTSIFKDLAVGEVVSGGQSMNPSAEDILRAIKRVPARNIFVFPNNKNIILAAQQAKELIEKDSPTRVSVFNSKSLPQGIAAVLEFNSEASLAGNIQAMDQAMENVHSGSVTIAVRTTSVNGMSINQGDYIGMLDGEIELCGTELESVAGGLIDKMADLGDYITIFYGEDVDAVTAEQLRGKAEQVHPDSDIVVQSGNQPLYHYIFSVE